LPVPAVHVQPERASRFPVNSTTLYLCPELGRYGITCRGAIAYGAVERAPLFCASGAWPQAGRALRGGRMSPDRRRAKRSSTNVDAPGKDGRASQHSCLTAERCPMVSRPPRRPSRLGIFGFGVPEDPCGGIGPDGGRLPSWPGDQSGARSAPLVCEPVTASRFLLVAVGSARPLGCPNTVPGARAWRRLVGATASLHLHLLLLTTSRLATCAGSAVSASRWPAPGPPTVTRALPSNSSPKRLGGFVDLTRVRATADAWPPA
jgi:hypothetical protein